jgi:hypothetical protein
MKRIWIRFARVIEKFHFYVKGNGIEFLFK